MIKSLQIGGLLAFTIRDIYLNHSTDNGMKFKDALEELQAEGAIELV